jgi:hypothetical protein
VLSCVCVLTSCGRVVLSIADAPGLHRLTSSVVVVYAPDDVQLKRLMKRDNIDEKEARQKIQAQMPLGIVCVVCVLCCVRVVRGDG